MIMAASVSSLCLCRETWGCECCNAYSFKVVLYLLKAIPNTVPCEVVTPNHKIILMMLYIVILLLLGIVT